jgi:hypothetical protein
MTTEWPWQIDYRADCAGDFQRIDQNLSTRGRKSFAYERAILRTVLKSLFHAGEIEFPLVVSHLQKNQDPPDFQLRLNKRRISAEARLVARTEFQHKRAKHTGGVLHLSGESVAEEKIRWRREFEKALDEKTTVLNSAKYKRGDEDWLLLDDVISFPDEVESRITVAIEVLQVRWMPEWYSRVFLWAESCIVLEFTKKKARWLKPN